MADRGRWKRFLPSSLLAVFVAAFLWAIIGAWLRLDVRAIAPALVVFGLGFVFVGSQRLRTPGWRGDRYWDDHPKVARVIASMMALGSVEDGKFAERFAALMQFGFGACAVVFGLIALVAGTPDVR